MAEGKKTLLTAEGLRKLEDELEDLRVNRHKEVSRKIKEAREQGDLSENAEYDAAIEEIEAILKNAEVVSEEGMDESVINIGYTVKIKDIEYNEEMEYQIVGSTEADSLNHKISNESPVGSALIGAKKGEVVEVETPAGIIKYEILDFSKK